jgi:hypothetical protein
MAVQRKEFNAREFIVERILPKVVELPPERWISELEAEARELPHEQRLMVVAESREILKRRKRVIGGIAEAVREVKELGFRGNPLGGRLRGVLVYGDITGKSYGEIYKEGAFNPGSSTDIDYIPVVEEDTQGVGDGEFNEFLERELGARIQEKTGVKPDQNIPITVGPDGLNKKSISFFLRFLNEVKSDAFIPRSWHFIGDAATRNMFAEYFRELKLE